MIPEIEQQDPKKIQQFQEEKLQELLQYLSTHSPYYQRIFKEYHIDIKAIKTLKDLQKLPTTTKNDLQCYNDDFLGEQIGREILLTECLSYTYYSLNR